MPGGAKAYTGDDVQTSVDRTSVLTYLTALRVLGEKAACHSEFIVLRTISCGRFQTRDADFAIRSTRHMIWMPLFVVECGHGSARWSRRYTLLPKTSS